MAMKREEVGTSAILSSRFGVFSRHLANHAIALLSRYRYVSRQHHFSNSLAHSADRSPFRAMGQMPTYWIGVWSTPWASSRTSAVIAKGVQV